MSLQFEAVKLVAIALMKAFPAVWYPTIGEFTNPESLESREVRMVMIAEVNTEVSYERNNYTPWAAKDDLALLMAIQAGESAFEFRVHAGQKSHIGTADFGKANCLGQLHHVKAWWTSEEWLNLSGTSREATTRCSKAILRAIGYHANRCQLRKGAHQNKWVSPLTLSEVVQLLRWYGNGNCGYKTTRTMMMKHSSFFRYRAAFETGIVKSSHKVDNNIPKNNGITPELIKTLTRRKRN